MQFQDSVREVEQMRIAREKQAAKEAAEKKAAEEKAAKLAAQAAKTAPSATAAAETVAASHVVVKAAPVTDIVDNVMGSLRKADTSSILDEIKRRRQANAVPSTVPEDGTGEAAGDDAAGPRMRSLSASLRLFNFDRCRSLASDISFFLSHSLSLFDGLPSFLQSSTCGPCRNPKLGIRRLPKG
jgi:hypothetical protein